MSEPMLAAAPSPTNRAGPAAAGTAPVDHEPGSAGRVLAALSVLPALLTAGWLVVAFPLAALGWFKPYLVLPLALCLAGAVVALGLGRWPGPGGPRGSGGPRGPGGQGDTPWWTVASSVAIAAGFSWFTAATHSEQVVLRRDPGTYAQIGWWLAEHGRLTAVVPDTAFGPSPGQLVFASPGFYQQGDLLVPQFMTGWPTALAAAGWVGDWHGILVLPALVGGCLILSMAGLAARLVGARWAPLAALLTALAFPVLRVSQTTYSEPLAFVLLAGGICLLIDVVLCGGDDPRGIDGRAFAAGLVLTTGELVRLDFGVDLALAVPVVAGLWVARRPGPLPFLAGASVGGGLAIIDCVAVTRPYIEGNWSNVRLMIVLLLASITVSVAVAACLRRSGRPVWTRRWWRPVPLLVAVAVVLTGGYLLARPHLGIDHSTTDPGVRAVTALLQKRLGLPIDGSRGYTEQTLYWVSWYLGWPLLAVALVGAAVLTWRVLPGPDRILPVRLGTDPGLRTPSGSDLAWLVALPVYLGSAVLTLLHPGITPDHPWADRRLVVEVIPAAVLLAVWTTAALIRHLGGRFATTGPLAAAGRLPATGPLAAVQRAVPVVVAVAVAATFILPAVSATAPVITRRTEQGELAATGQVCRALRPDDSVVLLDGVWAPTIRNQCGVPVAQLFEPTPETVSAVVDSIRSAGRSPVVGSALGHEISQQGLTPTKLLDLRTEQDDQQLIRRPTGTQPLVLEFWLVRP